MVFSKRIIFIYTTLILFPIFLGIIAFTSNQQRTQIENVKQENELISQENAQKINNFIDSFAQLESAANANDDFMLFLLNRDSELSISEIDTLKKESKVLSRLLLVIPNIYALRLFIDNDNIPESWPVIINSSRFDTSSINKWEFNFVADFMGHFNQYMDKSVCLTKPFIYKGNRIGDIQISMKMEDFFSFAYKKTAPNINNYIFKVENQKLIPITNDKINAINTPLTQSEIDLLSLFYNDNKTHSSSFKIHTSEGQTIFSYEYIPRMGIVIFTGFNLTKLNHHFLWSKCLATLLLIITGVLFFFVIRFATMRLMNRVFVLMSGLKEVGKGNLDVQLKVDGDDEVAETQIAFNKMIEQLKLQIKQIEQEQELAADTEVKAMQNQINAHFLYNVLETIKMQAVLNDQEDIAESLTVLGKMMRYCLRWRIHKVPLQQEVDYVLSYVYILNLRNDYIINLEILINQNYMNLEVPKMILQPIIENAFVHAIEPFGKDATIKVFTRVDTEKNILYLCIKDFGPGIPEDKIESIKNYLQDATFERTTKGSIGIKNIQQRLEMFYGEDYKIQIESELGKGTLICIPVPLQEQSGGDL